MNLEKKTLNFRAGDWDFLESLYHSRGIPPSIAIRTIISNFVDQYQRNEDPRSLNVTVDLGDRK